jgi:hypothetical protein
VSGNAEKFKNIVYDLFKMFIKEESIPKYVYAEVISVDGDLLTVRKLGETIDVPNIPNKTNQTLIVGDKVYLLYLNGNASMTYAVFKI